MVAQISSVAMQIIDAAMLGHLGTKESATVGLVSTTIWLFGGLCSACAAGFSVQVAHHVGAEDLKGARNIIRQGLCAVVSFSLVLTAIGFAIAPWLPQWLGADREIWAGATEYLMIVAVALPILAVDMLAAGALRCSGNIKVPSFLNALMCLFDVVFNYVLIFIFHLGTAGAAYGTLLAYIITMVLMESVIITLIFGYIGMMLGVGLTQLLDSALGSAVPMFQNPTVNFWPIMGCNCIMVLAGIIAGYVPAKRAVSIKLVEALTS
jgi:Na+-driven multidrug efflux pump